MPTYEYRCPECGNEFEKFGRMSDPPVTECPGCHGEARRKISAGAGLVFKGSGFYITDYRGEGYRKAAESDKAPGGSPSSESKPDASGKAGAKQDSKPAPKSPESSAKPSSGSTGTSSGGSAKSE